MLAGGAASRARRAPGGRAAPAQHGQGPAAGQAEASRSFLPSVPGHAPGAMPAIEELSCILKESELFEYSEPHRPCSKQIPVIFSLPLSGKSEGRAS